MARIFCVSMKCGNCGQDILQAHPEMCPYCKSKKLISDEDTTAGVREAEHLAKIGHFEEAALKYEQADLWNKARDCRLLAKKKQKSPTDPELGQIGTIALKCPHCLTSQIIAAKDKQETCNHCGTTYLVPDRVRELLNSFNS